MVKLKVFQKHLKTSFYKLLIYIVAIQLLTASLTEEYSKSNFQYGKSPKDELLTTLGDLKILELHQTKFTENDNFEVFSFQSQKDDLKKVLNVFRNKKQSDQIIINLSDYTMEGVEKDENSYGFITFNEAISIIGKFEDSNKSLSDITSTDFNFDTKEAFSTTEGTIFFSKKPNHKFLLVNINYDKFKELQYSMVLQQSPSKIVLKDSKSISIKEFDIQTSSPKIFYVEIPYSSSILMFYNYLQIYSKLNVKMGLSYTSIPYIYENKVIEEDKTNLNLFSNILLDKKLLLKDLKIFMTLFSNNDISSKEKISFKISNDEFTKIKNIKNPIVNINVNENSKSIYLYNYKSADLSLFINQSIEKITLKYLFIKNDSYPSDLSELNLNFDKASTINTSFYEFSTVAANYDLFIQVSSKESYIGKLNFIDSIESNSISKLYYSRMLSFVSYVKEVGETFFIKVEDSQTYDIDFNVANKERIKVYFTQINGAGKTEISINDTRSEISGSTANFDKILQDNYKIKLNGISDPSISTKSRLIQIKSAYELKNVENFLIEPIKARTFYDNNNTNLIIISMSKSYEINKVEIESLNCSIISEIGEITLIRNELENSVFLNLNEISKKSVSTNKIVLNYNSLQENIYIAVTLKLTRCKSDNDSKFTVNYFRDHITRINNKNTNEINFKELDTRSIVMNYFENKKDFLLISLYKQQLSTNIKCISSFSDDAYKKYDFSFEENESKKEVFIPFESEKELISKIYCSNSSSSIFINLAFVDKDYTTKKLNSVFGEFNFKLEKVKYKRVISISDYDLYLSDQDNIKYSIIIENLTDLPKPTTNLADCLIKTKNNYPLINNQLVVLDRKTFLYQNSYTIKLCAFDNISNTVATYSIKEYTDKAEETDESYMCVEDSNFRCPSNKTCCSKKQENGEVISRCVDISEGVCSINPKIDDSVIAIACSFNNKWSSSSLKCVEDEDKLNNIIESIKKERAVYINKNYSLEFVVKALKNIKDSKELVKNLSFYFDLEISHQDDSIKSIFDLLRENYNNLNNLIINTKFKNEESRNYMFSQLEGIKIKDLSITYNDNNLKEASGNKLIDALKSSKETLNSISFINSAISNDFIKLLNIENFSNLKAFNLIGTSIVDAEFEELILLINKEILLSSNLDYNKFTKEQQEKLIRTQALKNISKLSIAFNNPTILEHDYKDLIIKIRSDGKSISF